MLLLFILSLFAAFSLGACLGVLIASVTRKWATVE